MSQPHFDRRTILLAGAAGAALIVAGCATPGPTAAGGAAAASDPAKKAALDALLDRAFDEIVLTQPEYATALGLDSGDNEAARARLNDRSAEGVRKGHDDLRAIYRDLQAIGRDGLSGMDAVNYDTLAYYSETVIPAYDRFSYGVHSWPEPYTVSQLGGSYQSIPDFLDSQHPIQTAADADAYLARLEAFGRELDNETARLEAEYAGGIVPPAFVIAKTLEQMASLMEAAPAESVMSRSVARRAEEAGIAGDWGVRAARIVETAIYPALRRQADMVRGRQANAVRDAGVWRLPDGEAYYEYSLLYATTTRMSADDIHRLGLEQVAELTDRADRIFRAQGRTQGTVAERMRALGEEPAQLYPNTDAGREELLADLNVQMADMDRRLPEYFGRIPRAPVEIRRVPVTTEAGAPGGYYQPPALDGSRPGAYYINLRDTAEWPRWTLPTLTYHEASPGHHHQIALQQESEGIPMLRRVMGFSAFSEGWGLYAEQLADEMGVYEGDPWGELGYIQSFLFRAARLVVDTGLHHKRWSREQAIRYMVNAMGNAESSATTEIERYCVWPGQATSYKVGQTRWLALREDARRRLGSRFDIRGFHDTALAAGAMPLDVLARVVEDWVRTDGG